MSLREVIRIAYMVREAFEKISKEEKYNGDLAGLCQRASAQLYLECRRAGIPIEMWINDSHAFNIYKKWIVDITATQFGEKDKVVVRRIGKKRNYYHILDERVNSAIACSSHWGIPSKDDKIEFNRDRRIVRKHVKGLKRRDCSR